MKEILIGRDLHSCVICNSHLFLNLCELNKFSEKRIQTRARGVNNTNDYFGYISMT